MGQYQTRALKGADGDQGDRDSGVESEVGARVRGDELAPPPLAPVFGSPIDSKSFNRSILVEDDLGRYCKDAFSAHGIWQFHKHRLLLHIHDLCMYSFVYG